MHGAVSVTGVGYSVLGRRTEFSEGQLAVTACRAAIADAGLKPSQIDGLSMFPVRTAPPTGFQGPSLPYVQRSLGLRNLTFCASIGGNGVPAAQLSAVILGMNAIIAGQAKHVLIYRAHKRQERRYMQNVRDLAEQGWDEEAYTLPYGAAGGAARLAPWAMRHMHVYGTTQEQLGAVVVMCRTHAANNPRALWQRPITLDEYMESRWVSAPFKLFDCDYPIDGATAVLLSRSDAASSSTRKPIYIEAAAQGPGPDSTWTQWPEFSSMASRGVGDQIWSSARVSREDVDVAELYDGFSWLAICWLEDLGFVEKGEGGAFFEAGHGYVGGRLPSMTDGGQLGIGRLHGLGKLAQATLQLRGEAVNQVPGARVAIATAGGGPNASALLLTSESVT